MRTPRKDIIRVGDRVKVVDPRYVVRVGYPKTTADYRLAAVEKLRPLLMDLFEAVDPEHWRQRKLITAVAFELCGQDKFGGRDRTVHLRNDHPERMGQVGEVFAVKDYQTGRYYPPNSYRCGEYGSEVDYEPGGLADQKQVRVVKVRFPSGNFGWGLTEDWSEECLTQNYLAFPASHLRKLDAPQD